MFESNRRSFGPALALPLGQGGLPAPPPLPTGSPEATQAKRRECLSLLAYIQSLYADPTAPPAHVSRAEDAYRQCVSELQALISPDIRKYLRLLVTTSAGREDIMRTAIPPPPPTPRPPVPTPTPFRPRQIPEGAYYPTPYQPTAAPAPQRPAPPTTAERIRAIRPSYTPPPVVEAFPSVAPPQRVPPRYSLAPGGGLLPGFALTPAAGLVPGVPGGGTFGAMAT